MKSNKQFLMLTLTFLAMGFSSLKTTHAADYQMQTYWPTPSSGTALIKEWVDANGTRTGIQKTIRDRSTGEYYLMDLDSNYNWLDTWNYQVDSNRGVLETGDQYPDSSHNIRFARGGEIFWGNRLSTPVHNQVQFKCQRMLREQDWLDVGFQCIGIQQVLASHSIRVKGKLSTYRNVIKLIVTQQTSVPVQAIYYLAPGLGFIQIDYYDTNWGFVGSWYLQKSCKTSESSWHCR